MDQSSMQLFVEDPEPSHTAFLNLHARTLQRGLVDSTPSPRRKSGRLRPLMFSPNDFVEGVNVVGRQAGAWGGGSRPPSRGPPADHFRHPVTPTVDIRGELAEVSGRPQTTSPRAPSSEGTLSPRSPHRNPGPIIPWLDSRSKLTAGRNRVWTKENAFDADGDGKIGRAELTKALDFDGDGKVTWEEVEYFKRQTSVASAVAAAAFGDDVHPAIKLKFSKLDSGGDGVITRDELAKVLKKMPPPAPMLGCSAATFAMHAQARRAFAPPPASVTQPLGSCSPRLASTAWYIPHGEFAQPSASAKGKTRTPSPTSSRLIFRDLL